MWKKRNQLHIKCFQANLAFYFQGVLTKQKFVKMEFVLLYHFITPKLQYKMTLNKILYNLRVRSSHGTSPHRIIFCGRGCGFFREYVFFNEVQKFKNILFYVKWEWRKKERRRKKKKKLQFSLATSSHIGGWISLPRCAHQADVSWP
jgi:hypothetical protein